MVRMELLSEPEQKLLMSLPCPTFDTNPWNEAPALKDARIAIITTAGLHTRNDREHILTNFGNIFFIHRNGEI